MLLACGEHSSVVNTVKSIEGIIVKEIPLNVDGDVDLTKLDTMINSNVLFASVSAVQNEFGAIRCIENLAKLFRKYEIVFHVDAVQAIGKININYSDVDLISISGHKIHGPKGIGVLVKKKHIQLNPIVIGGQQEFGYRGGTSSVALQVAFTKALRIALEHQKLYDVHIKTLNTYLKAQLSAIEEIKINSSEHASNYILNFSISNYPSQVILNALSKENIFVSATASCVTKRKPVSTIRCITSDEKRIQGVIRVSFSYRNTIEELQQFIVILKKILHDLNRKISN